MRKSTHSIAISALSVLSVSSLQTKTIAKALAKTLLETKPAGGARVLALTGELGSGKTTFTQGFAKGLGVKEKILSPTFIIMKKFEILVSPAGRRNSKSKKNTKYKILNTRYFYHIDCYRLDDPEKELLHLGWEKIINDPSNIVVVEWADRIKKILPRNALRIVFISHGPSTRRLRFLST